MVAFKFPKVKLQKGINEAELEKALADGDVRQETADVKIRKDSSPTGKEESREYDKFIALNEIGMSVLCNGKMELSTPKPEEGEDDERTESEKAPGAADYFNYGLDLAVRQQVRQALEESLEGPEKTLAGNIKNLIKGGVFSREEAIETVLGQARKKGTVPADYELPASILAEIK